MNKSRKGRNDILPAHSGFHAATWVIKSHVSVRSALSVAAACCLPLSAAVVNLEGQLEVPLSDLIPSEDSGRLMADTTTSWQVGSFPFDIDLNGYEFTIDSGNGNSQIYSGAITGPGTLRLVGRTSALDGKYPDDIQLEGIFDNSPDSVVIKKGSIHLRKASSVHALSGPIEVSPGLESAVRLVWDNDDQIEDLSTLDTSAAEGTVRLEMNGFSEAIDTLVIGPSTVVDTGAGGVLYVQTLIVDGEEQDSVAYRSPGRVLGSGYIDVGNSGPPEVSEPPTAPSWPVPENGAEEVDPSHLTELAWNASDGGATYDVYLWRADMEKPDFPQHMDLGSSVATLYFPLESLTAYKWQVVAKNAVGETVGDTWEFTTSDSRNIEGELDMPLDEQVGSSPANLIGDVTTYWQGTDSFVDVNLNGFTFTIDTGGGNSQTYNGALFGPGTLRVVGHNRAAPPGSYTDLTFSGMESNSPDRVEVIQGLIHLNKSPGSDALAGEIRFSVPDGRTARVVWLADDQINDESTLDATWSAGAVILDLGDHRDTVGALALYDDQRIDTGESGVLTVKTLTINGTPVPAGTYDSGLPVVLGKGQLIVLESASGHDYQSWSNQHAGGQGPEEDYNGNGIPNGLEYFADGGAAGLPIEGLVAHEGGKLAVAWPRNPSAIASFSVETSPDLHIWTKVDEDDSRLDLTVQDRLTFLTPANGSPLFVRLRVSVEGP